MKYLLAVIFVLTLTFNLAFSLQAEEFSTSESYFRLRSIENIKETGLPLYEDELSHGGRYYLYLPLFDYIVALFALIMPTYIAAKIFTAICISSLTIIVYLITNKIAPDVSLLSAFMIGFIPIITSLSVNTISRISLLLPLMFLSLYFFINLDKKENAIYFIITFIATLLTHPASLILLLSFCTYAIINYLEGITITKQETETIIFSLFFSCWLYFLIFKEMIFEFGPGAIKTVVPQVLRPEYFSEFNILSGIVALGVIPFLYGIYTTYIFFFKTRKKNHYLYISFAITSLILLWTQMISIKLGLSILAIVFVIMLSHFYKTLMSYIDKTKLKRYKILVIASITIVFIATSVIPSFVNATNNISEVYGNEELDAAKWLEKQEKSKFVSLVHDGNFFSYKSGLKNTADTRFTSISNTVINDINTIYSTGFSTEAIPLLTKYNIDYIILTKKTQEYYNISRLRYSSNTKCFEEVYSENARIYESKCQMEVRR